ncbi:MAG: restriction endonuclease subunit S [Fibrobacter sp.]|nr:restriction endonuclease subunit S [Fibrobacter sp.]MDY6369465.1 restriction endonuclease subunit S [Fibrobacter sp.]MDY6390377.1 restriction endonuclease subunit S [Fibrobacter sp.]
MRKMKDSGLEWIGKIPENWNVLPVKWIIKDIKDGTHGTFNRVSEGEFLLSAKNVFEDGIHISDNESCISENDYKSIVANGFPRKDDVLMCIVGTIGRCCLYREEKTLAFQRSVAFLRANYKIIPHFLVYALRSPSVEEEQLSKQNGTAQMGLYLGDVSSLRIVVPPLSEQKKIADFLDEKCGEIDSIRSDVQREIEILNDYKKSVITEAVTKGLNPKTKLKDSGIEWIGKIPEGWDVKPNKRIMKKIKQIKSKYEGEPILSLTMNGVVVRDLDNLVGKRPASFDGYQIIKPGNLLMCLFDIDVTPRCIGLIKNKGLTSPAYSHFALENIAYAPYYYYYYLFLDMTKELLHLAKNLRHSLTEDDLGAIKTVIPPLSEQKAIADYLDEKCSEIDATIADKQRQLETLDEYKKSLIFEYVTGKKEVS